MRGAGGDWHKTCAFPRRHNAPERPYRIEILLPCECKSCDERCHMCNDRMKASSEDHSALQSLSKQPKTTK